MWLDNTEREGKKKYERGVKEGGGGGLGIERGNTTIDWCKITE